MCCFDHRKGNLPHPPWRRRLTPSRIASKSTNLKTNHKFYEANVIFVQNVDQPLCFIFGVCDRTSNKCFAPQAIKAEGETSAPDNEDLKTKT